MSINILDLEIRMKLLADPQSTFIFLGEDEIEWGGVRVRRGICLPFFVQALGGEDLGVGECGLPGGEEDVVFEVGGDDVGDFTGAGGCD